MGNVTLSADGLVDFDKHSVVFIHVSGVEPVVKQGLGTNASEVRQAEATLCNDVVTQRKPHEKTEVLNCLLCD